MQKSFPLLYHFVCVLKWNLPLLYWEQYNRLLIKMEILRLKWVQRTTLILSFYISEVSTDSTPLLNLITGCRNARHVTYILCHSVKSRDSCSSMHAILRVLHTMEQCLLERWGLHPFSLALVFSLPWVHVENSQSTHEGKLTPPSDSYSQLQVWVRTQALPASGLPNCCLTHSR